MKRQNKNKKNGDQKEKKKKKKNRGPSKKKQQKNDVFQVCHAARVCVCVLGGVYETYGKTR